MGNNLQPSGAVIWISIFICLSLVSLSAADTADPLSRMKEFHSNFISHNPQLEPSLVKHQPSDRVPGLETFPPNLMPHSASVKEHIVMDNSHPKQQVQNMYALNTNKQRDIFFDDTQSGNPKEKGLKNSMDIAINGNKQTPSKDNTLLGSTSDDDGIENMVDNAMANNALGDNPIVSKQHDGPVDYQSQRGSPAQQRLGNYMNIDVSDINVQATNTVEGGSAVATSNIEIKPVQIINVPPEVEEKLK
jgi:hypothetical protein